MPLIVDGQLLQSISHVCFLSSHQMLFGSRLTCSPIMVLQGSFSINFSYSWKHPYILWLCWLNTDWTWIPPSKKKESQLLELQLDVMTMQGDLTNPTITWSPLNLLLRTVPLMYCHFFLYSFTFCTIITPQFSFCFASLLLWVSWTSFTLVASILFFQYEMSEG